MTYEEFCTAYRIAFKTMFEYSPNSIGAAEAADRMAALSDDNPKFVERFENEIELEAYGVDPRNATGARL